MLGWIFGVLQKLWDVVCPTDPLSFWTMALTLATVGLIVVAGKGLRSLRLAKADMLTRSQREARACAIARSEELAEELIPKNTALRNRLVAASIPVFVQTAEAVRFDPDNSTDLVAAQQWGAKLPRDIHLDCIDFMNTLEAWAMHFTSGVADQNIAFGPCAPVYCTFVVQYYALLLMRRAGHQSGKFPNTVELFRTWSAELDNQKDGVKMQGLVKQVQDLQKKIEKKSSLPPALGTAGID
jgi:hypothetical protein